MKREIWLKNNYVLINSNKEEIVSVSGLDVKTIDWLKIENNGLLLKIDFDDMEYSEYKKILKKLFKLKKKARRKKVTIGIEDNETSKIIIGYVINYNLENRNHLNFVHAINAIFHDTLYDMYSYIYDVVCYFLDMEFLTRGICNFQNDICASGAHMGCCRQFSNFKLVLCEHMGDRKCDIKCISCKLFTCPYLWKEKIMFNIDDILLLDTFFGNYKKSMIKLSVYLPKERIMKRIIFINRDI